MKSIILFLVILICFCTSLIADELPDSSQLKRDKFRVGLECSIMNSGSKSIYPMKNFNVVVNYAIPFEYRLSRHWVLVSGIHKISKNSDIGIMNVTDPINYNFNFIRLPIAARYLNKNFFIGSGISFDYYINHNADVDYYEENDFVYDTNDLIYGWIVNCGIEGDLFNSLSGYMSINMDHDLNNFIDTPEEFKFSSYGFAIGLKYKFPTSRRAGSKHDAVGL